jgi:hypothetical protein
MSVVKKIFEFVVNNKSAKKDIEDTKKGIGGVTKETQKLNKETKKTPKLLKAFQAGVKGIGTALKAAGIGIAIALFAKFAQALMNNQKVLDVFNVAMEFLTRVMNDFVVFLSDSVGPIGDFFKDIFENPLENIESFGAAIRDNLIERFKSFVETIGLAGKAISQLFEGDFSGALETAKQAGKELVDVYTGVDGSFDKIGKTLTNTGLAIANYASETYNAADAQVELRKSSKLAEAQIGLSILQYQKEIEVLRQVRDNTELTIEARIKANDKIALKLQEQGKEEKKLANIRLDTANADLAANKDNVDLQIAVKNAKSKVADVEERIAGFTSEQLLNEQSLREERRTNLQELRKIGKSKDELSRTELENTLENQRLLIERTVENENEKNELLIAAAMEYNSGIQAIEDENLSKLEEIRNKYIPEDEIGLTPQEIFQKERDRKLEELQIELEDLELGESQKAEIIQKYNEETIAKSKALAQQDAMFTKLTNDQKVGYVLGGVSSIINSLAEGSDAAKGFAVAESLFNTYQGITAAFASKEPLPIKILNAATTAAAGFASVQNILSTNSDGSGATAGARGGNVISASPRFDTVGDSSNVRNAQNESERDTTPQEAYVVSGRVTNQQALDRNRQNNSRFV